MMKEKRNKEDFRKIENEKRKEKRRNEDIRKEGKILQKYQGEP